MPNGQSPTDTSEVWGQILFEARELRNKQDARLATVQRQAQLLVAGFLATTAVVLTAVSVYVASQPEDTVESPFTSLLSSQYVVSLGGAMFASVAFLNAYVWVIAYLVERRWKAKLDIDKLMDFFGSAHALSRLRRHLVQTFMTQFDRNERIVTRVRLLVMAQALMTLTFFYGLFAVAVFYGLRP